MPHGLPLSDFEAVLFDVDGTLVDSLDMIVLGLGDTYERFTGDRPRPEDLLRSIGRPLHAQFNLFGHEWPREQLEELVAFTIERFRVHEAREHLFEPAVRALRTVHDGGLKVALVTSKTAVELEAFMKRFPGAPWVHATVCASDVERPKPDPQSAKLACQLLGVAPERAVMIGDSVFDLRCARGAGLAAVAVNYGAGRPDVLAAEKPDRIFDTPDNLLQWVESAFLEASCPARRTP